MESIERLLNQFNLFVTDIKESPISGGSLILYIKKKTGSDLPVVRFYRDSEKKIKLNELRSWQNFAERVFSHREQLLKILTDITDKTGPVVGYGASARSSTLLNFCGIDTRFISRIADQNPLKHNCYTAATHIPIDSPENVIDKNINCVFILAWNFTEEIIDILKNRFGYTGTCIIPLPVYPKVIQVREENET